MRCGCGGRGTGAVAHDGGQCLTRGVHSSTPPPPCLTSPAAVPSVPRRTPLPLCYRPPVVDVYGPFRLGHFLRKALCLTHSYLLIQFRVHEAVPDSVTDDELQVACVVWAPWLKGGFAQQEREPTRS